MARFDPDPLLDSLAGLERSLQANEERSRVMRARIAHIRAERAAGRRYSEIVPSEERPLIVEMLTLTVRDLDDAGVRVRRDEARVLHDEGMTMEGIAGLFGVSRQRISALLRERGQRGRSDAPA